MDVRDIINLGATHLREKKMRTALTVLMVVIGVASIVALTSQTAGTSQNIQKSLDSLGPTSILVTPSGKTVLTEADVANLEALQNVSSVTPIVTGSATLTINGNSSSVTVVGVTTNGLSEIFGGSTTLYSGSLYPNSAAPDADVGYSIDFSSSTNPDLQSVTPGEIGTLQISQSSGFGSSGSSSGSKISIPVVGVLQERSSSLVPVDGSVVLSLSFAQELLDKSSFSEILVKANTAQNVSKLTSLLEVIYGNNARVTNTQQLASTLTSIEGETSSLYIVIAAVSLLVAAIGIMNVMLMAVSERIHDIGILKSVGFKDRAVLFIFLFQAIVIGALGGIIGLGAGVVASYALSSAGGLKSGAPTGGAGVGTFAISSAGARSGSFPSGGGSGDFASSSRGGQFSSSSFPSISSTTSSSSTPVEPVFTPSVIAESITIAILISIIAGIYPAWKASKMEPIDALRTL